MSIKFSYSEMRNYETNKKSQEFRKILPAQHLIKEKISGVTNVSRLSKRKSIEKKISSIFQEKHDIAKKLVNFDTKKKKTTINEKNSNENSNLIKNNDLRIGELNNNENSKKLRKKTRKTNSDSLNNDHLLSILNGSDDRMKSYSSLMEIINTSLSDIKNILSEDSVNHLSNEDRNKKSVSARQSKDNINLNSFSNKRHIHFNSLDSITMKKICEEMMLIEPKNSRDAHSRNKKNIYEKLYMTTIEENEEKNNDSNNSNGSHSSILEGVIVKTPRELGYQTLSRINPRTCNRIKYYGSKHNSSNKSLNIKSIQSSNSKSDKTNYENSYFANKRKIKFHKKNFKLNSDAFSKAYFQSIKKGDGSNYIKLVTEKFEKESIDLRRNYSRENTDKIGDKKKFISEELQNNSERNSKCLIM